MARSIAVLSLVAVLAVLTLMHRGAEGCPQYPPGQRCEVGRFLGPQWVWTGEDITNVTLQNDGRIEAWGPTACCAICQKYIADNGSKTCIGFTLFLTKADNGTSTCTLKHTAMATGAKCPPNQNCVSGML
ncbi:hypothetical protein WJX75_007167 [Coccomyxa subellipsoidea]|uniref:Uncharacterized protein n=1 Tax=Coccomyxa subellipsoidea TaxID=248742 RepID=A0ABR2YCF4_9CHLO